MGLATAARAHRASPPSSYHELTSVYADTIRDCGSVTVCNQVDSSSRTAVWAKCHVGSPYGVGFLVLALANSDFEATAKP